MNCLSASTGIATNGPSGPPSVPARSDTVLVTSQTYTAAIPKDLYYSAAWQVVEERQAGSSPTQYVLSPVYVDALILRDRLPLPPTGTTERYWVQQDANWNVTAIVDNSGAVVERYVYYPYGGVAIYDASWNILSTNAHDWKYLFQGGRYDWLSLYCVRHRDYDAALGRCRRRRDRPARRERSSRPAP